MGDENVYEVLATPITVSQLESRNLPINIPKLTQDTKVLYFFNKTLVKGPVYTKLRYSVAKDFFNIEKIY